jgi:hypothetical protein
MVPCSGEHIHQPLSLRFGQLYSIRIQHHSQRVSCQNFQDLSLVVGLPQITVGSAPALTFSRPAQRSLALQPTDSPSRLMRPSTPEAPAALLSPLPLRLPPGGAIQFPGGFISRCGSVPFTAHCNRLVTTASCRHPLAGFEEVRFPQCPARVISHSFSCSASGAQSLRASPMGTLSVWLSFTMMSRSTCGSMRGF